MLDIPSLAHDAATRIRPFVRRTPLEPSVRLGAENGGRVFLKLENVQHTGSFKVRGALNRMLALTEDQKKAGIVAASSGNHGLAIAFGQQQLGLGGVIYLPQNASPLKVRMLQAMGAVVRQCQAGCDATEAHARHQARRRRQVYISPYNDPLVVGGQATLGAEILDQLPTVDAIFASVGGGGLIAGIAGAVKAARPKVRIIGCLPARSPAMAASVAAGRIVDAPVRETLSDGTAGGIEPGAITFDLCQSLVDDWVLVSEARIRRAMTLVFDHHRQVIEGAAGVAVAGFLKTAHRFRAKTVLLVICGGNIDVRLFKSLICSSSRPA